MKGEKLFAYLMVAASLLFLTGSLLIVPFDELTASSSGGYPIFISVLCLALSLAIALGKRPQADEAGEAEHVFDSVIVAFMIMLVLYVVGILYIHYVAATLLFLFAAIFYLRRDNWKRAALISYICTFMILLVFKYAFSVIMP